jgi:DNA-binding response OmpR family regulator
MHPSFLRILLAADSAQSAFSLEQYLCEEGHEVIVVEARGDVTLRAARLLHPDLIILSGPLRGPIDGIALAAALRAPGEVAVPVVLVNDPAELPSLLALQTQARPTSASPTDHSRQSSTLDATLG